MIIEDFSDHVSQFKSFLRTKLNNIVEIESPDDKLFKKILYVSFLDSLAACVYPNRSNKDRFVSLIEEFVNWEYANRYCLLHLAKFTSITSDPSFKRLRKFVQGEVKSWPQKVNGINIIRIEGLPDAEEIRKYWHAPKVSGEKGISLDQFKYSHLLYQLRNSLVHQFQSRGTESHLGTPNEPYYQLIQTHESEQLIPHSIELVFPTPMLYELCKRALNGVSDYLLEGNINPFPYYHSGTYGLEELNRVQP